MISIIKEFKKAFFKNSKLNWKYANKVNKIKKAAAGEGTPTKYFDLLIGWLER